MAARTISMDDNDREVEVGLGGTIRVELKFQGGTGYTWNVEGLDEKHLKLTDTKTVNMAEEGVVGGPVLGVWYFKTVAPGDTVLQMLYYRVWEGKDKAVKGFHVRLHIVEKK